MTSGINHCACDKSHAPRRIVLTGGPGAGKTAVLELARHLLCHHVDTLPESASILWNGGFPRGGSTVARAAAQRAIFRVQRELEVIAGEKPSALVLCDRGTVDGYAYWPGPGDFWAEQGTSQAAELARYDAVIHLRVPPQQFRSDSLRVESHAQALEIDRRLDAAWGGHPRRLVVESTPHFLDKAHRAVELLRSELPACCRRGLSPSTAVFATL